jgi:GDP-L-fucose synthase
MRKFHEAASERAPFVTLWGTGTPRREFMHVDDLADACVFLMRNYDRPEPVNIGVGEDLSIAQLAGLIADVTGFTGEVRYDASKPDGSPQKLLDVSRLAELGWRAQTSLRAGIESTYDWYLAQAPHVA